MRATANALQPLFRRLSLLRCLAAMVSDRVHAQLAGKKLPDDAAGLVAPPGGMPGMMGGMPGAFDMSGLSSLLNVRGPCARYIRIFPATCDFCTLLTPFPHATGPEHQADGRADCSGPELPPYG